MKTNMRMRCIGDGYYSCEMPSYENEYAKIRWMGCIKYIKQKKEGHALHKNAIPK